MRDDELVQETTYSLAEKVPEQRRQKPRLLTLLRVATLIVDGRRELCLMRNISAMGAMIHVYSTLEAGQSVAVEMKTGQEIIGKVKWIDGSNLGLEFEAPIDVMAILASQLVSQSDHKPRMPRVEVRCPATLRLGAKTYRVTTHDVSQGGARIMLDAVVVANSEVVLSMEGFHSLHGTLRWCDSEHAGVTFNALIPWPLLVCWLKERRDVGPAKENWRPRDLQVEGGA